MEPTTQTRPPRALPPIIRYVAGAVGFGTLAAWLANGLACYWDLWGWCGFGHFVTVAGLVALLVVAPLFWSYWERAKRRAARGMWARGGSGQVAATLNRVTRWVIEGDPSTGSGHGPGPDPAGLITGAQRFEKRGWWITVPVGNGTRVWVDRWQLWQWLIEVEGRTYQVEPGESPVGRGYWEPRLGRARWLAYMVILEAVGAVDRATGDPRSRRYVRGEPWGRVEEYERLRPSGQR